MKTISGIILMIVMLLTSGTVTSQDLYSAVAEGDLVAVKEILAENPEMLNLKNENEFTPINLACESGQAGVVDYLLKQGADPYIGDRENSMPLHLAAISGSIESIDLLLDHGVDINIVDENDMTPLLINLSKASYTFVLFISVSELFLPCMKSCIPSIL